MTSTISVSELREQSPQLAQVVEKKGALTVKDHGKTVAYLFSRERMEEIETTLETLEIMANPEAMEAIRDYKAGKMTFKDVSCLDED